MLLIPAYKILIASPPIYLFNLPNIYNDNKVLAPKIDSIIVPKEYKAIILHPKWIKLKCINRLEIYEWIPLYLVIQKLFLIKPLFLFILRWKYLLTWTKKYY